MKHIFELVEDNGKYRYWKLPKRINRGDRGYPISEQLTGLKTPKFNPGVELAEDLSQGVEYVCVSDALTHIERLVFPAFKIRKEGKEKLSHTFGHIGGSMTMVIHGGDPGSIKPDEVYLRRLMMLNQEKNHES